MIEAAVAIIVANLPAFRSLLQTRGNTRIATSKQNAPSRYINTIGASNTNTSRSAIKRHSVELESLHSSQEGIFEDRAPRSRDVDVFSRGNAENSTPTLRRSPSLEPKQRWNEDPFSTPKDLKIGLAVG